MLSNKYFSFFFLLVFVLIPFFQCIRSRSDGWRVLAAGGRRGRPSSPRHQVLSAVHRVLPRTPGHRQAAAGLVPPSCAGEKLVII